MRRIIHAAQRAAQRSCLELSASERTIYQRPVHGHASQRRTASASTSPRQEADRGNTPSEFPGYTVDRLDAPLLPTQGQHSNQFPLPSASVTPPDAPQTTTASTTMLTRTPTVGETASLARSRVVFSTRLDGPAERAARQEEIERASTLVAGVLVPPKPEEPDNCCMSGCVNCVWDLYGEEVETWATRREEAKRAQQGNGTDEKKPAGREGPRRQSPVLADVSSSMDDDGGGSEAAWGAASEEAEDVFKDIPVGIREFMRTEKKLKLKVQQKKQKKDIEREGSIADG